MNKACLFGLAAGLLAACGPSPDGSTEQAVSEERDASPGHIVFFTTVHVMDEARSLAEAVAVEDGRIVYVGDEAGARALIRPDSLVVRRPEGALFPGFTDAHVHLIDGGESLLSLDLSEAGSEAEALTAIRRYAEAHPELPVIAGAGWNLPLFPEANPSKDLLDAIEPDRPVILVAADGHNAWVNSAALKAAGIDARTEDPRNGRIERLADGSPSGTLRETAMDPVMRLIPAPDAAELDRRLEAAMRYMNAFGYTAAIDASVLAGDQEETFLRNARRESLTLRLQLSLRPGGTLISGNMGGVEPIADYLSRREAVAALGTPFLSAPSVKLFVDGVIENKSAALLAPYAGPKSDGPDAGSPILPPETLQAHVAALDAAGFQVHFHAIGDRAVRMALDAVESARAANGPSDLRHHIAHIELIDPADIPRFKALGVFANAQALWAYEDAYVTDLTRPVIGAERTARLYPFGDLLRAGASLASGSDWPVSTADPMDALEVAVTRHDPAFDAGPALNPEQRIDIDAFMAALTVNGARLMHQEEMRGTIEVGKAADLVLLSADPYVAPKGRLSGIFAEMTLLEGRIVHRPATQEEN